MKVERVSYPIMTPSAGRGVLESICWRSPFTWRIQEIHVLRSVQYFSILRNEVNSRASERVAARWKREGGGFNSTADRAQRHTLALRDVAYVVRAQIEVNPDVGDNPAKFRDQFRRRVRNGRCFATPYLGCHEFAASFAEPGTAERPFPWTEDRGPMLVDMDYAEDWSGRGTPVFFEARIERGVLGVPVAKLAREA